MEALFLFLLLFVAVLIVIQKTYFPKQIKSFKSAILLFTACMVLQIQNCSQQGDLSPVSRTPASTIE
ncbi:MAG: hypothetical protein AB8E15_07510 [Bdellovibrionales bacterium]